jgi:hypothetical protein
MKSDRHHYPKEGKKDHVSTHRRLDRKLPSNIGNGSMNEVREMKWDQPACSSDFSIQFLILYRIFLHREASK